MEPTAMMRKMLQATLESLPIEWPKPSQEEPQHLCLDKGYDYDEVRELGKEFGYTLHIRPRNEEAQALKRQGGENRQALGSGTDAQLDEPFSQRAHPLGQKGRELSGPAPSYLCFYYVPGYGPIGIGSKTFQFTITRLQEDLAKNAGNRY